MNILVARFSSLGDILLTTPVLRALRRWNPEGKIDYIVKSEYEALLRENPNVDNIITWDHSSGISGFLRLVRELRGNYDLLVDLHRSTRSLLLRLGTGAGRRLKYPKGVVSRFIMIHTGWKAIAMKESVPERYLKALAPLGVQADEKGLDLHLPDDARNRVDAILARDAASEHKSEGRTDYVASGEHGRYLAIAPGARWATKRWLPERFADVADRIAATFGLIPVLIGHGDEREISDAVRTAMTSPVIDLTGRLDLLESGAVIETSLLLICNDSGLMHMASALSTPVVAVFGPTTRELGFYPYRAEHEVLSSRISCRPCHHLGSKHCPRGHHRCMTDISAGDVLSAAARFLEPLENKAVGRGDSR